MIDLKLIEGPTLIKGLYNGNAELNSTPPGHLDIDFNGKDFAIYQNAEEVAQRVKARLYAIYGEWVFDPRLGLPRFGDGSVHDTSIPISKRVGIIRQYIASTAGVNEVTKFDVVVDNENKGLRVAYEANTIYGTIDGEETL